MEVYRICSTKWANNLSGSGRSARWNSHGFAVLYTAQSCSLACLENLVHRNGFGLNADFTLVTITIDDKLFVDEIKTSTLPDGWSNNTEKGQLICSFYGDQWIKSQKSCIIKVPSAIISTEYNILVNPNHKDAALVKIRSIEPFSFDKRLLSF